MSKVASKTRQVGMIRAFAVAFFSVMVAVTLLMTASSTSLAATAPAAPVISSPAEGSYDNDGAFTLSGTAKAYTIVQVFDASSGMKVGSTVNVNALGNWQLSLSGLSDGKHAYKARVYDKQHGVYSEWSNIRTVTVDTKAPAAPYLAPNFYGGFAYGTAEPNSKVELFVTYENTTSLGTVRADGQGNWRKDIPISAWEEHGAYFFKARATDLAGNVSGWSDERLTNVLILEDGTRLITD